jgi:predicted RNase H-like nuclease (RuvC/YqgF family)
MALAQEDLEQIQTLINNTIAATPAVSNANVRYELELRDRTTKVEQELIHQREILINGFAQVDKRLEQMKVEFDKRFEQVDKRFEQVERRFELVDKRFEQMKVESDKRFEQVDKRFEKIDLQLEKQSVAIMNIHQTLKQQLRWSFGISLSVSGPVIAVLKLTG